MVEPPAARAAVPHAPPPRVSVIVPTWNEGKWLPTLLESLRAQTVPPSEIVVADSGFLAGSWSFTDCCIGHVVREAGISLQDAIEMASIRPRQLLGLPIHRLEVGQPADLVLFNWSPASGFEVIATIIQGS